MCLISPELWFHPQKVMVAPRPDILFAQSIFLQTSMNNYSTRTRHLLEGLFGKTHEDWSINKYMIHSCLFDSRVALRDNRVIHQIPEYGPQSLG